jgi:RNA polymerase sigma-70 factor (ECF subfamily)
MSQVPTANSLFEALLDQQVETPQTDEALKVEVEAFFDDFHDSLMRYLHSFDLEIQDAEDVIQEVFLALFRHLRAGKPRTNLKGWIFRVAHNLGLKRHHKTRRLHQLTYGTEQNIELRLDPAQDPEQQLLNDQRRRRLLAVVRALPDRDRECLSLRAEGLRYREIAQVLGISVGTVATVLERSLRRLRKVETR